MERPGGDIDKETGGCRPKVAALIPGERLADVAHRVTSPTGVELHAREVDECLGDNRVVTGTAAELSGLLEEGDGCHRLAGARRMAAPFAGHRGLQDGVAASLREAQRGLPVRVRGEVAGAGQCRRQIGHRTRGPVGASERPGVQRCEDVRRSAGRLAQELLRQAPSEERRSALLGRSVGGKTLEGAVVCGDCIGHTTVPEGGRAGSKFIRAVRVQSGVRWERHG